MTGKRLAITTGAIAILVIGIAAFVARDRIAEEWYLRKLDSNIYSFQEMYQAAIKLGELRSTRALPSLLQLLKESKWHDIEAMSASGDNEHSSYYLMAHVFKKIGQPAIGAFEKALVESAGSKGQEWREVSCYCLGVIGLDDSVLVLTHLLQDVDEAVRKRSCIALGEIGTKAKAAIPKLVAAKNDDDVLVRDCAARALEQIQGTSP